MLLFVLYKEHELNSTAVRAPGLSRGRVEYTNRTKTQKSKKKDAGEGQRLTSMLHKFQETHRAPGELRLNCCDWLAEGIPELSILMESRTRVRGLSTPFRNGVAGASTGYTARVESSNVGRMRETRLAPRDS